MNGLLGSILKKSLLPSVILKKNITSTSALCLKQIEVNHDEQKQSVVIKGKFIDSPNKPYLLKEYIECQKEKKRFCPECTLGLDVKHTDVLILSQYVTPDGSMLPRIATGLCKKQQKRIRTMVVMAQRAGLFDRISKVTKINDPLYKQLKSCNSKGRRLNRYYFEDTIKTDPLTCQCFNLLSRILKMVLLEVCVDSILSAVNASESGADRIELCSALSEGGLTPSIGLFMGVKGALAKSKTKIFCMIRIRRGDFNYSDEEIDAMITDVEYFKKHAADGIVFGCLDEFQNIHKEKCLKVINAWGNQGNITFHRAFDETSASDMEENLKIIKDLGFSRILSSGYKSSAEVGIESLKNIIKRAREDDIQLKVMPGAGITKANVSKIITETQCNEIHASARSPVKSNTGKLSMGGGNEDLQPLMVCDPIKVKELIEISKNVVI
ncbi:CLUMA_CG013095, isoform A [Clunio marinus]|uniref:Copper homeostasis protein cutC homolog n=1 Tax=Clunio marinus TaxID=568069 RepID=A0A1J1IHU7_9DIPT|nr:CLUMA_CG013095, isoform A [Clunio marinus]